MKTFRWKLLRTIMPAGVVLGLAVSDGWAVRPYTPVHPDPVLESWRWRTFPELRGLGLACMAEDKERNMWFGVRDGVRRYDGVNWTPFTEADGILGSPVIALRGSRDGSIYAGTPMGISRFRDGKWRRVFPPEGGPMWPVTDLMEASDGSMWAGTAWGALHLNQEGPTLIASGEVATSMRSLVPNLRVSTVPDAMAPVRGWSARGYKSFSIGINIGGRAGDPSLILAVASGGPGETAGLKAGDRIVAESAAGKMTIAREGLPAPFDVKVTPGQIAGGVRLFSVYDICEDRNGVFWFGLWNGEIVRYDVGQARGGSRAQLYAGFDERGDPSMPRILQTQDGTIWAVSESNYGGVNRFDGQNWSSFRLSDQGGTDMNPEIVQTGDGTVWVSGQMGLLYAYRDGAGTVYRRPEVPMPSIYNFLLKASDGALWIGGVGQEAVRFDLGVSRWTTYRDLRFECETADGSQWFVSRDSSVVRYDGKGWTRYGAEDGLMDQPRGVLATRKGVVWAFGADDSIAATARFNGSRWVGERHPRLSFDILPKAYESSDGSVWFSAIENWFPAKGQVGGLLQYDGNRRIHHTPPEAPPRFYGMEQTPDGTLWFGGLGLWSYDGREWKRIPEPEGVTGWVHDLAVSADGRLWGATRDYGVFRYDGKGWTFFDVTDGLADNMVTRVLQTSDGSVWAVTTQGTSRFDGRTWTTYALPLDLPSEVGMMRQSRDGAIWIQDFIGVWKTVRYHPDTNPPETEIVLSAMEVSQPGNTTMAWNGSDPWKATSEVELQFAWRMDGSDWSAFSPAMSKIFVAVPSGNHTFEVRARDRDFNVDPTPASVRFTVVPPVWRQPWFMGLMVAFGGTTGFLIFRILIAKQRLIEEMDKELQTAHEMQMALMPKESPGIEGLDIAGRCIPANHVGGDFFQYFPRGNRLIFCIADVSGKAMEAAIPVVMFDGILDSQMELGGSIEDLFGRLNLSLCRKLDPRTFVCLAMGELDLAGHSFSLSNSGCPYPYHFRSATGEVVELQVDAYPLGVRLDTAYHVMEVWLGAGDRVVFCSDGIAEAVDGSGEQFGYERTTEVVRQACQEGLSAEATIDRILSEVNAFRGGAPQADDMTCVVLRVVGGSAGT